MNLRSRRYLSVFSTLAVVVTITPSLMTSASTVVPAQAHTTATTIHMPVFCQTHTCTVTKITIPEASAGGYKPVAPAGANDLYRCTYFDPKFLQNQMIVGSSFVAQNHGTAKTPVIEIHHAILYQVPPTMKSTVLKLGKSWTCFGSPIDANDVAGLGALPWAAAWAPGATQSESPAGYGNSVPAGSAFALQIHYNLLASKAKDNSYMNIITTPAATRGLTQLNGWQSVAPPELPCPAGSTGKLCNKAASLADLATRFGQSAVSFNNLIEWVCQGSANTAGIGSNWHGNTWTSCIWRMGPSVSSGPITLHAVGAHMHLLGKTLSVVLCHTDRTCANTSQTTALFVNNYNFDNQQSYPVAPTVVNQGDYVKITCTYDPTLRKFNPQTAKLAPRYITWGDGSSDEMCLSTLSYSVGANT